MKCMLTVAFAIMAACCYAQYTQRIVTKQQADSGVLRRYADERDFYSSTLYLLRYGRFRLETRSGRMTVYSEGRYRETDKEIMIKSDLQKDSLPIKLTYREKDSTDKTVTKIAIMRDLKNQPVIGGVVFINDDSTSCIYGDGICSAGIKTIDRIKVVLENKISSGWVNVPRGEGILQITIMTLVDLNYRSYNGRFRKEKTGLKAFEEH